ncbi:MAG TPA: HAD family hydrolase [Planctomycetota bacterium]|nr:HAD family hydrolase [Planctomycetota bacterium]
MRGVVFDLDGTLADTLATIAGVANFALRSLDLPEHPRDAYRTMVGDGIVVLCRRALPPDRKELEAELLARVRARYADHYLDGARLYDGMRELLLDLKQRGARLGVLSNKPDELTRKTVDGLGVGALFDVVMGQREGVAPKPDPAGAVEMRTALGLPAHEILYVGDTAIDMQTARAAGFPSVGVLWGFRPLRELKENGADFLAMRPAEILPIYQLRADAR